MSDAPDDDVRIAIRYAQGLVEPVSPSLIEALGSLLLSDLAASAARIRSARERIEQRAAAGGIEPWTDDARMLLTHALDRLAAASVSTPEQEQAFSVQLKQDSFPDVQPFSWDRRRRRRLQWQIRRMLTALRARLSDEPAADVRAPNHVVIRVGSRQVGRLKYFVCDHCRLVLVGSLNVEPRYQGLGLGGRAVAAVFRRYRHHHWRTTAQYDTSGRFWPNVAAKTGASFTQGQPCHHIRPPRDGNDQPG